VSTNTFEEEQLAVQQIRDGRQRIFDQLSNVIVGQEDVIEQLLISLFAGGNCLITGAPGLAKTLWSAASLRSLTCVSSGFNSRRT
jgi:MoxR-like ATPase